MARNGDGARFDKTAYQREYQAKRNAEQREITIRECADMSRRLERLDDPLKFLKGYFPRTYTRPFAVDQIDGIHSMIESVTYGVDDIFCAERGGWKTETMRGVVVYCMMKQLILFPLILGATAEDAGASFEDIKLKFECEELAADFPEVCDPIIALDRSPTRAKKQTFNGKYTNFFWRERKVTFPQIDEVPGTGKPSPYGMCAMTYRGLDGSIRGVNIGGRRPDVSFFDDLETSESARMPNQVKTRESILDKDVGGLSVAGSRLPRIGFGTIQNRNCLTKRKLDQWGGKRYPGIRKWPDGERSQALRDEYIEMYIKEKAERSKLMPKAHAFYLKHQDEIEHGVEMANPHNYETKKRPDGTTIEVSSFQRICNLIAIHTNADQSGLEYVLTEIQNDPPEESGPASLSISPEQIMTRITGLRQKEIHPDTELITAAFDLGKRACHWEIVAWLDFCTGLTINYGVAEVDVFGVNSSQEHIDMALRRTLFQWRDELIDGVHCEEMPHNILIDSGTPIIGKRNTNQRGQGEHAEVVYDFIRESQDGTSTFKASKGLTPYGDYQPIENKRIVGNHWHANLQEQHGIWLYLLDTDWAKQKVHEMWMKQVFDEAQQFNPMSLGLFSAILPDGKPDTKFHHSFARHQVAERREEQFIPGTGLVRTWNQVKSNNHWLDTKYMNLLAALMKELRMPTKTIQAPPPKPQPQPEPRNDRTNQGYRKPFIPRRSRA